FVDERGNLRPRLAVVQRRADERYATRSKFFFRLHQDGHLRPARDAPGSPEVKHYNFSPEVRDFGFVAVQIFEGQLDGKRIRRQDRVAEKSKNTQTLPKAHIQTHFFETIALDHRRNNSFRVVCSHYWQSTQAAVYFVHLTPEGNMLGRL